MDFDTGALLEDKLSKPIRSPLLCPVGDSSLDMVGPVRELFIDHHLADKRFK